MINPSGALIYYMDQYMYLFFKTNATEQNITIYWNYELFQTFIDLTDTRYQA